VQPQLRAALHSRGAEILEEDAQRMLVVTRALAALQAMLGFPQTLRALAGDNAGLWVWLSHYAPAAGKAEHGTQ
jgi:translation elongation factor EF-G